jgi:hypothetical protein
VGVKSTETPVVQPIRLIWKSTIMKSQTNKQFNMDYHQVRAMQTVAADYTAASLQQNQNSRHRSSFKVSIGSIISLCVRTSNVNRPSVCCWFDWICYVITATAFVNVFAASVTIYSRLSIKTFFMLDAI